MTIQEAMQCRHSVRAYLPRPIEGEPLTRLEEEIRQCNQDSGLRIQLITDDPVAFGGRMAHYGKFEGVHSYLALVGPKGPRLEETCGWYGERLALLAQQLGLNTCWVALTYKKNKSRITISPGEKLACVIAIGYGAAQGVPHRSKPAEAVCRAGEPVPPWFRAGVEAALLAPTAMNQQKFLFTLGEDGGVSARATGGFYSHIDLGIVKYHFQLGAGRESFRWLDET